MVWIVTANSNRCCIYRFDKKHQTADLVQEINHAENKLKKSDYLTSDKPGHYQTDGSAGGSYEPHTDPKAVEVDNFAREIASVLNDARNKNAYRELVVVMASHMSGLLHQHLDKHVKVLIKHEVQKDVMALPHHELLAFLQKNSL